MDKRTDQLVRGYVGGIRAFAAVTTTLVADAQRRHDCWPVATAALGRLLTGTLLLAADLKTKEQITIRIAGDGPLGELIADAGPGGGVRGFVKNPHVDMPLLAGKLDVGGAVGKGQLHATRFTGLKQPFTGSINLVSGEIAEDITQYLLTSEQIPSTMALGVLVAPDGGVAAAGGFWLQAMPEAQEDELQWIEENIARLPPISALVQQGASATEVLLQLFSGREAQISEPQPVEFRCTCSREKVRSMLEDLGTLELQQIATTIGYAEVRCHFCGVAYRFEAVELQMIVTTLEETAKERTAENTKSD